MDTTFDSLEIPNKTNLAELREIAEAACRTMELVEKHDLPLDDDLHINLPPPASTPVTNKTAPVKTSTSLLEIYNLLREYGVSLNATVDEVRNTIINKLLLETDNQDPGIRLKAMKMLGEIPEIGLFSPQKPKSNDEKEDSDVTERLKAKLQELKKDVDTVYETKPEE
jgi:hypothetical protein